MAKANKEKPKAHYPLEEVRRLIDLDLVDIWPEPLRDAKKDFGWGPDMILEAIKQLEGKHLHKRDVSPKNGLLVMDFYKATVMNEHIYTHFYIEDIGDDQILVIQSFKQDEA